MASLFSPDNFHMYLLRLLSYLQKLARICIRILLLLSLVDIHYVYFKVYDK